MLWDLLAHLYKEEQDGYGVECVLRKIKGIVAASLKEWVASRRCYFASVVGKS